MKQHIQFCTSADGTNIAYATSGSGPPLVYIANWLTHLKLDWNSPLWSHWFQELSRGHTLVRFDARGNGLSDRDANRLSLEGWVQDLAAVMDDLGLERFPILGFCQGGATGIAYAAAHPNRVSRLILYNSYVRGAYNERVSEEERREADALSEMIEVGWGQESSAFRKLFANLLVPGASLEQLEWYAELQKKTVSPRNASRLWKSFHTLDMKELAPELDVPTLILHVEENKMVDFDEGRKLASLIPEARFVPLDSVNHVLLEDEPAWERFVNEVRDFLGTETFDASGLDPRKAISRLTPRESEVLTLMARGLNNDQIAQQLVISSKTVRNHVSRIYRKLDVDTRAQAIVLARETQFVSPHT